MEQTNTNEQLPEELTELERKELIWEQNHEKIANAIRYLQRDEINVSVSNIAKVTKLSRKTVYKHFTEEDMNPAQSADLINKFILEDVIKRVSRKACFGDMKAAKLYLELMGLIKRGGNTLNASLTNGNRSIMVNGHTFSEDMVQNLSAENLNELTEFVKSAAQSTRGHGLQNAKKSSNNFTDNQHVDG